MELTGGAFLFSRTRASALFLATIATLGALAAPESKFGGKDLSRRWGLGVDNIGPGQTPTLSVNWHVTRASAFGFNLGIDTTQGANFLELTGRLNRHIFIEDNMFFDLYMGAGVSSQQATGGSSIGYVLEGGTSARFFLEGLPNLALGVGGGLRLESIGSIRFRSVVNAGAHYYF